MLVRRLKYLSLIFILPISLFLASCEHEEGNEKMISSFHSDDSHRTGENCMNCHSEGGKGEGWFTVAGSVYDSTLEATFPNSLLRLYMDPSGAGLPEVTLEVDALGNFYTTEAVNFGESLYAFVSGDEGIIKMIAPVSDGQCNGCHGETTDRIWAK